jgi:hypothetical protein
MRISGCQLFFDPDPYRIFFYSSDGSEPAHANVQRDAATAKYWLASVRLENNAGFRLSELRPLG